MIFLPSQTDSREKADDAQRDVKHFCHVAVQETHSRVITVQNHQNNQQTTNNQQITIRKPSGATNTYTPGTQNTPTQPTVTTQAPQMTPYQMNLQMPTQNQPQQWNLRTLLGTAYHIGQSGQTEEASNLFNLIQTWNRKKEKKNDEK